MVLNVVTDEVIAQSIEVAHTAAPHGRALVFEVESFVLSHVAEGPLANLPWEQYETDVDYLTDLFEPVARPEIEAARSRAQLTAIASTTVRDLGGQPTTVSFHAFGPEHDFALAVVESGAMLELAEAASGSTIRTRITCAPDGTVISTDGPAGSYANATFEVSRWAEHLISRERLAHYRESIATVLEGELYTSLQAPGTAPGLHFGITIVRSGENIVIDLHDRSHQFAALEALQRSQEQFDQLSETLPVGVFLVEGEGRVKFASERLREQLGPRIDVGFNWLDTIHPDDQAMVGKVFVELAEKRHFNMELRAKKADGEYSWWRWAGSDVRDENGTLEYVIGFVEDISEWRELNSRIAYQASFDGLTDLPNRVTLVDELRKRLEHQDPTMMTGVLFVDLDDFKLINDTQGHNVGDTVLIEVAERFRRALRPNDLVGRFGGDEFVVVASDISGPDEAEAIGRRLHDILSTPVLADGRIITVNATIGIALSEHESASSEQLIGDADIAMYEAKASGRNRTVVFDATLRARASQRFDMTADLRHARRRRELRLEYQPIVDLQTDAIVGAEALVRWDHPTMGRIEPSVFIPLAEEIGLIDDVGEWVVEQACADLDRLRAHHLADPSFIISINASAQQFQNVAVLATSTLASLDQYGLEPSNLRFELTESVPLTQIPDAAKRIRQLTDYGFGLAIDDFGTGYSSLGYLTMLPFDVLKLDLSLTAQLEPGSPALAVVDSLTRMAAEMGFSIVAEGIETEKQHTLLCEAGVQLGQGYWISRPLQLASLISILEADD